MADFDWEGFLDLADGLVGRRGDAGAERTVISRAYYAVFHRASAYLVRRGERLTLTGDDHSLVWDWFLRPGGAASTARVGSIGRRLRFMRRQADYDASPWPSLSNDAQSAVRLARHLMHDLDRLR